jgi:hypothetical protein
VPFLLSLYCHDHIWRDKGDKLRYRHQLYRKELESNGHYRSGDLLGDPDDARTVRIKKGELDITYGPFDRDTHNPWRLGHGAIREMRERLIGYYIIAVATLDEAVQIAARAPLAEFGSVEVRALGDFT